MAGCFFLNFYMPKMMSVKRFRVCSRNNSMIYTPLKTIIVQRNPLIMRVKKNLRNKEEGIGIIALLSVMYS